MDLSRIIVGPIVTEKAERLKADRTYTLKVAPSATKIDVQNALKRFFEVDVESVRMMRVRGKSRQVSAYQKFTKRNPHKKAVVTLSKKSKALDLAQFNAS